MEAAWVVDGTTVSLVGNDDLVEIPRAMGDQHGASATELKICFCPQITRVENLEKFKVLKSLVLDNNSLGDNHDFPALESLETLWLNSNNITRLDFVVGDLARKYPNLSYLSMLKNPCCPNYLVGKNSVDYKKYRLTVISSFRRLKFLDSSPVTKEERDAALAEHKKFHRVDPTEYQKASTDAVSQEKGLQNVKSEPETGTAVGKTHLTSYGTHSEGNRFITDL